MEHDSDVSPQVKLAQERTFLAYERTLMAWVRTAISLITFGFTLYKFFYFVRQLAPRQPELQFLGARTFGMVMIATGIATLWFALFQHRREIARMRRENARPPFSYTMVLAIWIAVVGILAFVEALLGV